MSNRFVRGIWTVAALVVASGCLAAMSAPPKVVTQPKAAPLTVGGILDGDGIGKRVLVRVVKARAVDRLVSHGFSDVTGKKGKTFTREQARELVDSIDDDLILKHAQEKYGEKVVGEGGRLEALVQWLIDHKEEILSLVKFVISLLALFADGADVGQGEGPAHGFGWAWRAT